MITFTNLALAWIGVALTVCAWFLYLIATAPVDSYEDGAQSDSDVQDIKDSMRGTL